MEQKDIYSIDPSISYDIVELPSKGIYYKSKKKALRVAYLTAADENILTSPNLVATNRVIDEILKRKVLDKDFNTEELVEEDRQAILIFLRNTAWGPEYTISTIDPKTNKEFEFTVDLSTLKVKDFILIPNENDEFTYTTPVSKAKINFKFLTKKQIDDIEALNESWNGVGPVPIVTRRMEGMIKSVNDNNDPLFIRNFVEQMPIKDSQEFRKFINNNKPGIDLVQQVKTPSGENIQVEIGFGVNFFRPFYGL